MKLKSCCVAQALMGAIITWVFIADNTGLDLAEQVNIHALPSISTPLI